MRGSRRLVLAAVCVAVVAVGVVVLLQSHGDGPAPANATPAAATAEVTRTDLTSTVTLQGTLGYADEIAVKGHSGGHVTWLPTVGTTVSRGATLMRVDDRAVAVFYGSTPLFRALDTPGLVGRDVRVVADNLAALGYRIGSQPKAGTVVDLPAGTPAPPASSAALPTSDAPASPAPRYTVSKDDAVLTPALTAAIRRWQQDTGRPHTGELGADDAVVLAGEARVTATSAQLGDDAGNGVLSVASTTKVVHVPLQPGDAQQIQKSGQVTVVLPDGATADATIGSISTTTPARSAGNPADGQPAQQTVTVVPTDAAAVQHVDPAPVQVNFTGETRKGVLAVPIGALLALSGGGYGLQKPDGTLLAVTTGLFTKGMVEVTGTGVAAGLKVVTTS